MSKLKSTELDSGNAQMPGDDYVGQQRAVDTRREILQHAATIFAENGFDGCSMREIAAAADVSHANIRYHFCDKETLWTKVIRFLIAEAYQGDSVLDEMADSGSPIDQFRAHTRNAISYFAYHPELQRIIYFETMLNSSRLGSLRKIMREVDKERIEHIRKMQAAGVLKPDLEPELLNGFIGGALAGAFVVTPARQSMSRKRLEAMIDQYTDMIVSLVSR